VYVYIGQGEAEPHLILPKLRPLDPSSPILFTTTRQASAIEKSFAGHNALRDSELATVYRSSLF
jgi:hypothetical protein